MDCEIHECFCEENETKNRIKCIIILMKAKIKGRSTDGM